MNEIKYNAEKGLVKSLSTGISYTYDSIKDQIIWFNRKPEPMLVPSTKCISITLTSSEGPMTNKKVQRFFSALAKIE